MHLGLNIVKQVNSDKQSTIFPEHYPSVYYCNHDDEAPLSLLVS